MMYAAQSGSVEALEFILANGGSVTDKGRDGYTVMVYAAVGGCVGAMKFVLANRGSMSGVLRWCDSDVTRKFCLSCGGS